MHARVGGPLLRRLYGTAASNKHVVMFPGQGSQEVGMGSDIYRSFPSARRLLSMADKILRRDLSDVMLHGPPEQLVRTYHAQPALLLHGLAIMDVAQSNGLFGLVPSTYWVYRSVHTRNTQRVAGGAEHEAAVAPIFTGHSVGLLTAFVAARGLSIADGLRVAAIRGKAMQRVIDQRYKGRQGVFMVALSGCKDEDIEELLEELKGEVSAHGVCEIAAVNAPEQVVISGDPEAVELVQQRAKERELIKRSFSLKAGGPFHTSILEEAREKFVSMCSRMGLEEAACAPRARIVSSVNGELVDKSSLLKHLEEQITAPVQWSKVVSKCEQLGATHCVEIGGRVLGPLVRRTCKSAVHCSLTTVDDLVEHIRGEGASRFT